MKKIQHQYRVVANEKICPRFFRLVLDSPSGVPGILPGQFIHVRVQDSLEPFFRRPFSVFRAQKHMEILYEVVGKGSAVLSRRKKGDPLDVLGPLGRAFDLPPAGVKQVVMVAGGVGVAPFMMLSDRLKKKRQIETILLYGGRTRDYVFDMKEFKKNGCQVHVSTDDGSRGIKGRVSKLFSKIRKDPETTMIYTCGPGPMMLSVQEFAKRHCLKGQGSCEEVMACGLGACLGCSIPTRSGYKTVCHDGPVFDLQEIIFERSHS